MKDETHEQKETIYTSTKQETLCKDQWHAMNTSKNNSSEIEQESQDKQGKREGQGGSIDKFPGRGKEAHQRTQRTMQNEGT